MPKNPDNMTTINPIFSSIEDNENVLNKDNYLYY